MSEKPEWFEISEDGNEPNRPKNRENREHGEKGKKNLYKFALLAAPLVLIGAVAGAASGEDDDAKPAIDTTITSTNSGSANNESVAPASTSTNNSAVGVANPASGSSVKSAKKGVGVPKPSGKGEHEGREGGEGGEHDGFFGGDDD